MQLSLLKWFKKRYQKVVTSIAFLPAMIAVAFLLLSYGAIAFDFSEAGKAVKSRLHWLSLKDASTARTICSVITGGIISLTVFSFSMVMILLNQAASQMTNRILGRLIGNRFQQTVLGIYIGTIVYGLFLLSTIRDINTGIYVPALSTYLLIALTIVDIFLFIYFLHYITNSVKYETIINGIYKNTIQLINKVESTKEVQFEKAAGFEEQQLLYTSRSGFYAGFHQKSLLNICSSENTMIRLLHPQGTYLLEGTPLLVVESARGISAESKQKLADAIDTTQEQEETGSYEYGFQQLMEIALKALSPGINDPETAVISLRCFLNLLAYRVDHPPKNAITVKQNVAVIQLKNHSVQEIVDLYLLPIWDYGKQDRVFQNEMIALLPQILRKTDSPVLSQLFQSALSERQKM